jgi:hypothetical protein
LFDRVQGLLLKVAELFVIEKTLCGQVDFKIIEFRFALPENWVHPDMMPDIESFLDAFESTCSGRGKLSGISQLACFYALLLFSVVKSLLTDVYLVRGEYDAASSWRQANAVRIASVYKVLVSMYGWASKTDILLDNDGDAESYQTTRQMLNQDQWNLRSIKGSKEFLLGLESSPGSERVYNGFFVQKSGSKPLQKQGAKTIEFKVDESDSVVSDLPAGLSTGVIYQRDFPSVSRTFVVPDFQAQNIFTSTSESCNYTYQASEKSGNGLGANHPAFQPVSHQPRKVVAESSIDLPSPMLGWEHIVVENGGLTHVPRSRETTPYVAGGRRKGKLSDEVKQKAAHVRSMKACWACWVAKVPVSKTSVSVCYK